MAKEEYKEEGRGEEDESNGDGGLLASMEEPAGQGKEGLAPPVVARSLSCSSYDGGDEPSLLSSFVGYSSQLAYADKTIKLMGYTMSTLSFALRRINGEESTAAVGLAEMYSSISMTRCLMRIFGCTSAWQALKDDSWAGGSKSPTVRTLTRLQAWSMLWYHPLEHLGWAAYTTPKFVRMSGDTLFARSNWAWLFYVIVDFWVVTLKERERKEEEEEVVRQLEELSSTDDSAFRKARLQEQLKELARRKRCLAWQLLRDIFYLPNAVHWSFEKGLLPKWIVAVLGLAEALTGVAQTYPWPEKRARSLARKKPLV